MISPHYVRRFQLQHTTRVYFLMPGNLESDKEFSELVLFLDRTQDLPALKKYNLVLGWNCDQPT